jgi:xanthine/uracil/vitamin C permease (AzgA family)
MSALASVLMGALANLPVGMAPGMGLNAYVRPSITIYHQSHSFTPHLHSSHTLSLVITAAGLSHTEKHSQLSF